MGARMLALLTAACLAAAASRAETPAEFYRGKTFTIVIGIAPGGAYDLTARSFARHIGRHLPGSPTVIVQNMPGANSVIAANHVFNIAPKDGTVIWGGSRTAPYEPMLGNAGAKFDVRKLRWLGSAGGEVGVTLAWHTARVQRAEDLFRETLIVGAVDPGAENYLFPNAFNNLLGTKFNIVPGYAAQEPIFVAMERGEVEGNANASWSNLPIFHPDWFAEKKVRILMQLGLEKHPDLPEVPLVMQFARTDEQRRILEVLMGIKKYAYPYFMAPGIPEDRAAALAAAFRDTMEDKEFREDIRKMRGEIAPSSGEEMARQVNAAYDLPPALIEQTRRLLTPSKN